MNLSALAGNASLKGQLERQTARRGLSHAYIISGAPLSGKRTLAGLLAAALVCSGAPEQAPCLSCPGCRKAMAGIHPDIITLAPEGREITVAQVRALRADAYIRPNEAGRKVYIIQQAQSMNQSAQNAMLKLLEEGPAYAAFLFLTDNAAALLPTVRSRCESLALSPVTAEEAMTYLAGRFPQLPESQLQAAALACQGRLGLAVEQLEGGQEDSPVADTAAALLDCLSAGEEAALLERCVSLEKWEREQVCLLLDTLIDLLGDALLLCTGAAPHQTHPVCRAAAERAAKACSRHTLLGHIAHLERLRDACGYNIGAGHLAGWLCAGLFS